MKTKKEILDEIIKEETIKLKDRVSYDKEVIERITKSAENGELLAIVSTNLAGALGSQQTFTFHMMQDESTRKSGLLRTIFTALYIMQKAERLYEEQLKVE